jgi:ATP-binding cassette, subfamily B, multidrug efflux pump
VKNLRSLIPYFLRYRWHFLGGILFVFVSNYFRILQPQTIRKALDYIVSRLGDYEKVKGTVAEAAFRSDLGTHLLKFGGLVIGYALLMGVFMYFMRQTIIVMSRLIEYDQRKAMYGKYQELDLTFYRRNNTGDLMARITEDVSKVRMFTGPAILYGINLISLFVLVIYSMLKTSPILTFYALAPLPFLGVSIYFVSSKINFLSEKIQQQLSKMNSVVQEIYSGIRVVKSYVREDAMGKYFNEEAQTFRERSMKLAKVDALFFPLMLVIIGTSVILTVYMGGHLVENKVITPGVIAEFVIYVNMLTFPVTSVGWVASLVQQASVSQKRIDEFMMNNSSISSSDGIKSKINGEIIFENVNFIYPDTGIQSCKDLNIKIHKGQKLAIVGKTGSGKSTIADLIVRMYDVTSGEILIDGKNIKDYDLKHLRSQIGYVPQDVFLFSDTVSSNIKLGNSSANQSELDIFSSYAGVKEEIQNFPMGYDTVLGERGVTLSGGQKQRLTIARALIKNPEIVLLDDCLSAVDPETEQKIFHYLIQELKEKTTILITHRFYGLHLFDYILVMDQGKIIQEGTHKDLMELGGVYSEMWELQRMEPV